MKADDVRGEIIGEVSQRYSAMFKQVELWLKHGSRIEYSVREHSWWSEALNQRDAVNEYLARNRRESTLGDGSVCIHKLEEPTPSEIWSSIAGKAHLYETAYFGQHCVKLLRVVCDGTFSIYHPTFGRMHAGCHEMTQYCL